jgi:hypothetical protein
MPGAFGKLQAGQIVVGIPELAGAHELYWLGWMSHVPLTDMQETLGSIPRPCTIHIFQITIPERKKTK